MSTRFMYVRDNKWQPIGCVAITADHGKQRAEYALSMLNPIDTKDASGKKVRFDSKQARLLSMERLINSPVTVRLPKDINQHSISMAVMQDIAKSKAPSRARKFAALWVEEAEFWFANA